MRTHVVAVENPWTHLPRTVPFVLSEDEPLVRAFNARAKPDHCVDLSLLPEPFLGRHDAPVVVLCLNPDWDPADATNYADPTFADLSRENLGQATSPYPFFLLDPTLNVPGSRWWRGKLRCLIDEVGVDAVASRVLCVEYFPYHSHRFGSRVPPVPSQEFSFDLVRAAIEREAVIVVMRSERRWEAAVPELVDYPRRFSLCSVQNVCVSPRNCPEGYRKIVNAIKDGA